MKRLEELGISPAPWVVIEYGERTDSTKATEGALVFVDDGEEKDLFEDDLTKISNARLIAAAPMLYKALQSLVEYIDRECVPCGENACELMFKARAALAEAAGEEVARCPRKTNA